MLSLHVVSSYNNCQGDLKCGIRRKYKDIWCVWTVSLMKGDNPFITRIKECA